MRDCRDPPRCSSCREIGHSSANCHRRIYGKGVATEDRSGGRDRFTWRRADHETPCLVIGHNDRRLNHQYDRPAAHGRPTTPSGIERVQATPHHQQLSRSTSNQVPLHANLEPNANYHNESHPPHLNIEASNHRHPPASSRRQRSPTTEVRVVRQRATLGAADPVSTINLQDNPLPSSPVHVPPPLYVTPTTAAAVIKFSQDIALARERLSSSAVGLIVDGSPSLSDFVRALSRIWDWDWEWKAQRISDCSFTVLFPSQEKLKAICSSEATFLTPTFSVRFLRWSHDIDSVILRRPHAAWIKIRGVPLDCRSLSTIKEILWGYVTVLRLSSTAASGDDISSVRALVEFFAPNLPNSIDLILGFKVHRLNLNIIDMLPEVAPPVSSPSPLLDNRSKQFPPATGTVPSASVPENDKKIEKLGKKQAPTNLTTKKTGDEATTIGKAKSFVSADLTKALSPDNREECLQTLDHNLKIESEKGKEACFSDVEPAPIKNFTYNKQISDLTMGSEEEKVGFIEKGQRPITAFFGPKGLGLNLNDGPVNVLDLTLGPSFPLNEDGMLTQKDSMGDLDCTISIIQATPIYTPEYLGSNLGLFDNSQTRHILTQSMEN